MKFYQQLLLLIIIDFLIIRFWVLRIDPDPSVAIGIIIVVPAAVIINLDLALIMHVVYKQYSRAFLINSLISAVMMYFLFLEGIKRHQQVRYDRWDFNIHDTAFKVSHVKLDSTFSISYSLNPWSSTQFMYGKVRFKSSAFLLETDTTKFIIKNNYLFGFQNNDSIKMKRFEY